MKHNVIFIEGLPGSGKTQFSQKLYSALQKRGVKVGMFKEGDVHPIDLAWCSIMDLNTYENFKSKYPELNDSMDSIAVRKDNQMVVPYTKLDPEKANKEIYEDFARYEIYRTNSLETFKNAHMKLWNSFNEEADPDTLYIFECVFLQNHINELILKYNIGFSDKVQHFKTLMKRIERLNPVVYHIRQTNVEKTLKSIIEKRKHLNPEPGKGWIDMVIDSFDEQPYSKELGYIGIEGVLKFSKDRQKEEINILDSLNVPTYTYELNNDYDEVFASMLKTTNQTLF